jgi:hypothetical protein
MKYAVSTALLVSRPLDFLVVADHSDYLGVAADFVGGRPELLADATVRRWYGMVQQGGAVWRDPGFDPAQRAFYYARVLEIPTPRWTAYDAKYYGIQMPAEVPMATQERACTSPIWYTPAK